MVLISGCHIGDCHYIDANTHTEKRYHRLRRIMERGGLDRERLHLAWVSAAEGQTFQEKIGEMQKKLSAIPIEEIERSVMFFGEREKERQEKFNQKREETKIEAVGGSGEQSAGSVR